MTEPVQSLSGDENLVPFHLRCRETEGLRERIKVATIFTNFTFEQKQLECLSAGRFYIKPALKIKIWHKNCYKR